MVYNNKFSLVLIIAVLLSTNFLQAQIESKSDLGNKNVIVAEFLGQIQFVEGRIMDLAKAMPADNYTWRPADGVRSVAEVYRHITFANYNFGKFSGVEGPEVPADVADREEFETGTSDKNKILADLAQSFEQFRAIVSKLNQEQLDEQIKVFGMEMSRRNFVITSFNHLHEHLGQSIAYARMNGIVPPWSK